jgi:hypothetical protein
MTYGSVSGHMSAIQFKHDDIFQRITKSMSSGSLALDEHSWEIVKSQALQKARAVQENVRARPACRVGAQD